jgi:hypothetical protein
VHGQPHASSVRQRRPASVDSDLTRTRAAPGQVFDPTLRWIASAVLSALARPFEDGEQFVNANVNLLAARSLHGTAEETS